VELGYALPSEEHGPLDLVRNARAAEQAGFGFGLVSDHFHPWVPRQGHSPFVWSVIGGVAGATERFRLGTAAELAGRAEVVPHGPDPEPMLNEVRSFAEAGFTHVYVHQIGPDQEGFLDFARRELLPHV